MEQLLTSPGFTPLCSGIVIQETHLVSTWTQKIRASRIATPLDDDEKSGVDIIDPHGRKQKTNCISEAGLYSIILRSRKP